MSKGLIITLFLFQICSQVSIKKNKGRPNQPKKATNPITKKKWPKQKARKHTGGSPPRSRTPAPEPTAGPSHATSPTNAIVSNISTTSTRRTRNSSPVPTPKKRVYTKSKSNLQIVVLLTLYKYFDTAGIQFHTHHLIPPNHIHHINKVTTNCTQMLCITAINSFAPIHFIVHFSIQIKKLGSSQKPIRKRKQTKERKRKIMKNRRKRKNGNGTPQLLERLIGMAAISQRRTRRIEHTHDHTLELKNQVCLHVFKKGFSSRQQKASGF